MNAKASCCAFLKVRFMFALNRFVYSVENKSGNSEFFHRVFTVCAHTHPTPTNDTHRLTDSKHPGVLINSTVHIFCISLI